MRAIRWMILLGFLVFAAGILFLTYLDNDRVGYALGVTGFALVLLGVVGGNWLASHAPEMERYGRAHRVAVVGFSVTVVGIVVGEFFPNIGVFVFVGGLCIMFFGFILTVWSISKSHQ